MNHAPSFHLINALPIGVSKLTSLGTACNSSGGSQKAEFYCASVQEGTMQEWLSWSPSLRHKRCGYAYETSPLRRHDPIRLIPSHPLSPRAWLGPPLLFREAANAAKVKRVRALGNPLDKPPTQIMTSRAACGKTEQGSYPRGHDWSKTA